jgi:hypothetical protein
LRGRRDEGEHPERLLRVERRGASRMLVLHERRAATVCGWPLNVVSAQDTDGHLLTLGAVATADLHNRVLRAGVRIIPAAMPEPPTPI